MLKQYHKKVICRLDGKEKDFYFTVSEESNNVRFGARYGCNDKMLCQECAECWLDVRKMLPPILVKIV